VRSAVKDVGRRRPARPGTDRPTRFVLDTGDADEERRRRRHRRALGEISKINEYEPDDRQTDRQTEPEPASDAG